MTRGSVGGSPLSDPDKCSHHHLRLVSSYPFKRSADTILSDGLDPHVEGQKGGPSNGRPGKTPIQYNSSRKVVIHPAKTSTYPPGVYTVGRLSPAPFSAQYGAQASLKAMTPSKRPSEARIDFKYKKVTPRPDSKIGTGVTPLFFYSYSYPLLELL